MLKIRIKKYVILLIVFLLTLNFSYANNTNKDINHKGVAVVGITYYVSASGNDDNNGTSESNAWRSISKVNKITKLSSGDKILFEGGSEFSGSLNFINIEITNTNIPIEIATYGTGKATINAGNENGIYILNSGGIYIDNLIIKGSGPNVNNNKAGINLFTDNSDNKKYDNISIIDVEIQGFYNGISIGSINGNSGFSNVTIKNCKIYNCLDHGIISYGSLYTEKVGYSHLKINVINTEVYNIKGFDKTTSHSGNGIVLGNVENSKIEKCTVHDCGEKNIQCGGPVGIWYYESKDVTIEYCEAYNISSGTGCDGGGFDIDGGVINGTMQYNYSHDNDGAGYLVGQFNTARAMNNIIVRYNISQNDAQSHGGSLSVFNTNNRPMSNIYFYNNTVYVKKGANNKDVAGIYMYPITPVNDNIGFYNNIIYSESDADLVFVPVNYDADFFGNLYYSNTTTFNIKFKGTTYNSISDFRATGNEQVNGQDIGVQADPLLTNPGNAGIVGFGNNLTSLSQYKIQTNSPAINQGISLDFTNDDIDFFGNDNKVGVSRDIGAHEIQGVLSLNDEHQASSLSIHPNPSVFNITITSDLKVLKLSLFDLLGREVKNVQNSNNKSLDISKISPATYFVRIQTEKGVITKQIIKK